jgi:protease-4
MARRTLTIIFTLAGMAVFAMFAAIIALYLLVGRGPAVPSNATLVLRLGGELVETTPPDVLSYLAAARAPTLREVVDNLRKAKVDDRITGVLLVPAGLASPYWGQIQEIRDAVLDFKQSGKRIFAYLEHGSDRDYYLATAADKVFLMPSSSLDLTGIASYDLFLRGTLDLVGAYPDLHRVGQYKTAVNTFTERGFTEAHREMALSLNRDLFDQIVGGVAQGRNMSEGEVRTLIDRGPFLAEEALRQRLVDGLAYADEVENEIRAAGEGDDAQIDGDDYANVTPQSLDLDNGPRVAVIYASGTITSGRSGHDPLNGSTVGSETLSEYIREIGRDDSIRAVVLRIDSPGGSATASDTIWRELTIAKRERADWPIVASMSNLAASGGYYIAMAADAIVAQPSTLTGSIGIFGGKFVTGSLYEKFGANIEATSSGRHAEMNSPERPYSAEEARKVQQQLQAFYDQFIEKAAKSRGSTPESIDRVAQGRVWTGRQAVENGLVDELGGLGRAIAVAKSRAGIAADSEVELVVYPPRRSLYDILAEELSGASQAAIGDWLSRHLSAADIQALRVLRGPFAMFRRGEPLALMPAALVR